LLNQPHLCQQTGRPQRSRKPPEQIATGSLNVSLTLPGNVNASAERKVNLAGFRQGVDGQWVCRRVEHELGDTGFTTRIEGEVPMKK